MKRVLSLIALLLLLTGLQHAQRRQITQAEYDKVFKFALTATNDSFPFIFTVTTEFLENGKVVSKVTDIAERVAPGKERETRTTFAGGKKTVAYQLQLDYNKNYCSDDNVSWRPSQYQCFGPVRLYGPRSPESVEYSVEKSSQSVTIYRIYSVFSPLAPGNPKDFRERLVAIDSRGFFFRIRDTEGTLGPKKVKLERAQTWKTNAKIEPIVAPMD